MQDLRLRDVRKLTRVFLEAGDRVLLLPCLLFFAQPLNLSPAGFEFLVGKGETTRACSVCNRHTQVLDVRGIEHRIYRVSSQRHVSVHHVRPTVYGPFPVFALVLYGGTKAREYVAPEGECFDVRSEWRLGYWTKMFQLLI